MNTIFFILFFFSIATLLVGIINPKIVLRKHKNPRKLNVIIIFSVIATIFFVLGVLTSPESKQGNIKSTQKTEVIESSDGLLSQEELDSLGYELLRVEKLKLVNNYDYLVTDPKISISEEALTLGANSIRKHICEMKCNITLWDNKVASQLELEEAKLIEEWKFEEADAWALKHRDFVAEHMVAFLSFEVDVLMMYPWKEE